MALTRQLSRRLEIPHEPGQFITIRKLSHYQLMMAEDAQRDRAIGIAGKLPDFAQRIPQSSEERERSRADAELPENKYDRGTVLRAGITDWSYDEAVTPDAVDDLDEETAAWAFDEIMRFSVRSAAERKASAGDSQPISDLAVEGIPAS